MKNYHNNKKQCMIHGTAGDSLVLTFVKCITAILGLLVTKLLSTQFSLQDYGTYSQAMLIVSTVTSISILGLTDATNYFYNVAIDDEKKKQNISTIFGLQYIIGTVAAVMIMLFSTPLIQYFNNEQLKGVIYIAAWLPLFDNLIPMLQVLFVSIGKAKVIALRNFIVSATRLIAVVLACFFTNDIRTIFILIIVLDIAQVGYFMHSFAKLRFSIMLRNFRKSIIPDILKFSVPMAIYVLTNSLSRDIDKYVISFFTDTETLAIYTNAAKILPFDLLAASFLTVMIPIITRQIRGKRYREAQNTFKAYLRVGYIATWMFVAGAVVVAKELMLFFYDEKYLPGLSVFIVYLFADMMRFANTSLVLTAKGKTRMLMYCSLISLGANLVFNIVLFKICGIIGPAISTMVITSFVTIVLVMLSAHEIKTDIFKLFDWKEVGIITMELLIIGIFSYMLKCGLYYIIDSYIIVLIMVYCFFIFVMCILNKKRIIGCLQGINSYR